MAFPKPKTRFWRQYPVLQTLVTAMIGVQRQMVDWLFNGTSAQKGKFVPTAGGEKPAQSAKDGQRDTMHITLRYTITM